MSSVRSVDIPSRGSARRRILAELGTDLETGVPVGGEGEATAGGIRYTLTHLAGIGSTLFTITRA